MKIFALTKGRTECGDSCPFYLHEGPGWRREDGSLNVQCLMLKQDYFFDCNHYKATAIEGLEVSEQQWQQMLQSVHRKAKKVHPPYPPVRESVDPYTVDYYRLHPDEKK